MRQKLIKKPQLYLLSGPQLGEVNHNLITKQAWKPLVTRVTHIITNTELHRDLMTFVYGIVQTLWWDLDLYKAKARFVPFNNF
jgi:hypothetical protein